VSSFNDFLIGFFKPIRDLVGSLILYGLFVGFDTIRKSTIQNSDFSFNIWVFLIFYIGVATFLEILADAKYNLKWGYNEPINSSIRIIGLLAGTIIFSSIVLPIYYNIGGNFSDVFISTIIAAIFSIGGTTIRLFYNDKWYYY